MSRKRRERGLNKNESAEVTGRDNQKFRIKKGQDDFPDPLMILDL
jgi:hypothetical protein